MEIITGGVTAAKGFLAAGVEAGIKYGYTGRRKRSALSTGFWSGTCSG